MQAVLIEFTYNWKVPLGWRACYSPERASLSECEDHVFPPVFSGARFDDGAGGDNEVQRTMLELINQLDGFDPRGNIKVLMATNRPDTLDPALMRPGRLDRKIEFSLPDLEVGTSFHRRKGIL